MFTFPYQLLVYHGQITEKNLPLSTFDTNFEIDFRCIQISFPRSTFRFLGNPLAGLQEK